MPRSLLLFAALLAGFPAPRPAPAQQTSGEAQLVFRLDSGFDIPESMQHDPMRDVYLVSNVAAHATRPLNNGYISRVLPDGTVDDLRFIEGGRDGVTLHAPKGMLVEGDTLWVADVDRVRAFHAGTGRPLATVDLSGVGARFLNALARRPEGALYVTDTGLDFEGEDFHPGPDRIYRVEPGGEVGVALEAPALEGPNGIAWDPARDRFLVVSLRGDGVLGWAPGDEAPQVVARGTGGYDGVAHLTDGRVVVSSQDGEALQELRPDGTFRELVGGVTSPGDIGVDARRNRVLIPRLGEQIVEVWRLGEAGATDRAPDAVEPVLVAEGLEVPWALAFAPDGRIFVTERPGRVRVIGAGGGLRPEPWAELEVAEGGDGGLQGIALAPDFRRSGHVYLMGTYPDSAGVQESRILRLTDREGRGRERTEVFGPVKVPGVHRGGALAFGPDGMLYTTVGDGRDLDAPQDPRVPRGAVLRLMPDGSVPPDNPIPGSPVFAMGVRNSQGLVFDPESGALFASEHGPTDFPGESGWTGRDEVNAVLAGENYGWPVVAGPSHDPRFVPPIASWTPAVAPGGLGLEIGAGGAPVLWVGALRGESLIRLALAPSPEAPGWRVISRVRYLDGELGRIRAVAVSPAGVVHFTTSNLDADGRPGASTDRLFRLEQRRGG